MVTELPKVDLGAGVYATIDERLKEVRITDGTSLIIFIPFKKVHNLCEVIGEI